MFPKVRALRPAGTEATAHRRLINHVSTLDPLTGSAVGTTNMSEWVFVYPVNEDGTVTNKLRINVPSTEKTRLTLEDTNDY